MDSKKSERIGYKGSNNQGCEFEVIDYIKNNEVYIKFIGYDFIKKCEWRDLINGSVKNPFYRTLLNIGFVGNGKYNPNKENKKAYKTWNLMMTRCYNKNYYDKQPTYKDCTVAEKWHNFQNFAKWYEENYYSVDNETMCLDKDILVKGNKVYSPETCIFVPSRINLLFVNRMNFRGDLPLGVSYNKNTNKYIARVSLEGRKQKNLGYYKTPLEAFEVYKKYKYQYIEKIAEEYKNKIPQILYDALISYRIEITD